MRDHFSVGRGRETASPALQLVAKLDVVVDLTVLHDGDGAALNRDRLVAAGHVDDAEARGAERRRTVDEQAMIVGTAVAQRAHHPRQPFGIGPLTVQREESSDAAHAGVIRRTGT